MASKHDEGKPRVGLVLGQFALALWEVSKVGTFGADKYEPSGWLSLPLAYERYTDAMWRHILQNHIKENFGQRPLDDEMGIEELAAVAWNALALLEGKLRELPNFKEDPQPLE